MIIDDYIQVLDNYKFSQRTIERALGERHIVPGTDAFSVPEKERELARAIMWDCAAGLVNGGAFKKKIGDRSITTANLQISQQDRAVYSARAKALRAKWGEPDCAIDEIFNIIDYSPLW